jgi:Putative quorum-sensing-regulated virulence factor
MNVRKFLDQQQATRATGSASGTFTQNGVKYPVIDLAKLKAEEEELFKQALAGNPAGSTVTINGQTMLKPANGTKVERVRPTTFYAIPFGKHKGMPLHEVPTDYLRWCLSKDERAAEMRARHPEFQAEAEAQLGPAVMPLFDDGKVDPEPEGNRYAVLERRYADLKAENEQLKQQHDADAKSIARLKVGAYQRRSEHEKALRHNRQLSTDLHAVRSIVEQYRTRIAELERTTKDKPFLRPRTGEVVSPKLGELRGIIKRWYRALALRFHEDRGGSKEQAIVVTEAYSTLIKEIDGWQAAEL